MSLREFGKSLESRQQQQMLEFVRAWACPGPKHVGSSWFVDLW